MKSLLLTALLATTFLVPVHAQTSNGTSATSSKAQRLEWPRTFSGQPDFAFTRDEALAEARARAARENAPLPMAPTLPLLLNDDAAFDPLGINKIMVSETTVDASGTIIETSGTVPANNGQSLMERLMAQAVDLPAVASTAKPDLTEFNAQLSATISNTIANWQPQPGKYDFGGVLNSLSLQAIVTSPVKYAVINQQRYVEGETFRITVPLQVPESEITAAMRVQMPVSGTLPATLQASYEEAYTAILGGYTAKRNLNPTLGQQTLVLPVRIIAITPRQVMLDVNGQSYALQIRYAY